MGRFKTVVIAIVALLAVIVVFQNRTEIETRLLFVTVTMPRAVLLFATLAVGFALGLLTAARLGGSKSKPKP